MPNGRSGGFLVAKNQLKELLKGLANHKVLGQVLSRPIGSGASDAGRDAWSALDASAAAIVTMIDTFPGKRIWVEEQDHSFYVLHLDHEVQENLEPEAEKWVIVRPESPLFGVLKRRHGVVRQWVSRLVHRLWLKWT